MAEVQLPLLNFRMSPESLQTVCNVLNGTYNKELSPGHDVKITGLSVLFNTDDDRFVIKGLIDGEAMMLYFSDDDFDLLVESFEKKLERGKLRWSIDKFAK
jgi:hypothetical protein